MALSAQESQSLYGTTAYTGWGEAEAAADAAFRGLSPQTGGGAPSFDFDFVAEAEAAYGELGKYYDRVLKETKGDVNKAISRLVSDYERGLRFTRQDAQIAREKLQDAILADERAFSDAREAQSTSELARGISRRSAFGGEGATSVGIAEKDRERLRVLEGATQRGRLRQGRGIETSLSRFEETSKIQKERGQEDLETGLARTERDLEQERRRQAGELATNRGNRAFRRFSASLI